MCGVNLSCLQFFNTEKLNCLGIFKRVFSISHQMILVAPQITPFSIGDGPANWGDQTSVICSVIKGDRPIEITWSLNGKEITLESHPDISISRTGPMISLLSIDSVTARHAGEYSCMASNLVGFVSRSAELTVNGTHID